MITENYLSAGKKHYNDACRLLDAARYDNCAYLAGYVVECGLKELLSSQGTVRPQSLGHDLEGLSRKALLLAAYLAPARNQIELPSSQDYEDLLADWQPSQRYAAEGTTLMNLAESRIEAANETFSKVFVPLILDKIKP